MPSPIPDSVHSHIAVSFDLVSMWNSMGLLAKSVAVVLAVMSVYSLALVAERLLAYARTTRASRSFTARLAELLSGGKFADAVALSKEYERGHLARIMGQAVGEYCQGRGRATGPKHVQGYDVLAAVRRSIERNSIRTAADLRRGLGGLATISSSAPFVGLLGTVGGIITAFQSMAATGSGGLGTVSAGIAEALVTTAFGLFVAIPAVMMFNYFTHRAEALEVEMAACTAELLDFFTKREESQDAGSRGPSTRPRSREDMSDQPRPE